MCRKALTLFYLKKIKNLSNIFVVQKTNMKKLFLLSFLILGFYLFPQKSKPDDILGIWVSNLEKGRVEITKEGDKYFGRIIWLKVPTYPDGSPKADRNNPDKTKHGDLLMGSCPLQNLEFKKDHWDNGTIYDPENGKTYSCRATLKENKLELRGYLGISQIGRTQTWTRFEPDK